MPPRCGSTGLRGRRYPAGDCSRESNRYLYERQVDTIGMASANISIRADVYHWLKAQKVSGESFSDVLQRLMRSCSTSGASDSPQCNQEHSRHVPCDRES